MDHNNTTKGNGKGRGRSGGEDGVTSSGFPVHSQVRRIKLESESEEEGMLVDGAAVVHDLRRESRNVRRQRSRSPLGLSSAPGRPVSVCD
ncbi:hypothetical protein MLD38_021762 [Melastoma candidum]|uniref:Uncharacterized protein n=1 Tax=Melastoma candidum TaxID=119954 RepID=A0ACB9QGA5_9MYRT|nr:hypothetical protein MLD38_021762 [Melastoma candidum]